VFNDANGRIGYVDTFSVDISTIMLDSMQTSDMTAIFTGAVNDNLMGKMTAVSYIPFTFIGSSVPELIQNDNFKIVYDSLMIYFRPTGDYLGDTTTRKTVNIYRVNQIIEPKDKTVSDQLYNHDSFTYDSVPLATLSFLPRPASKRLLKAHLPDSLGQLWLNSIIEYTTERDDSSIVASPDNFLEYFKGIALVPQSPLDETWSITFKGQNTNDNTAGDEEEDVTFFEVRLYYHRSDQSDNSHVTFQIPTDSYLFTSFPVDRSNTVLANMKGGEFVMPSALTNHTAFIQSGAGLVTKITVPGLKDITTINRNITVLDARLIMRPKARSYNDNNPLPKTLYVNLTDFNNRGISELTDLQGNTVQGTLTYGKPDNEDPYYSFPVMQYVSYKLSETEELPYSMLVTLSKIDNSTSFKRLLFEDQQLNQTNVQIQLYYFTY
jgi:hypothetical protein